MLHPADVFDHPSEVVNNPNLTLNEKRAVLALWASEACAVDAAPELPIDRNGALWAAAGAMMAMLSLFCWWIW